MNEPAWQFEHSVECNVNRAFVWSYWTDISNWERLEGKAVEWIRLEGPFVEGASGATKTPGQDPQHWQITRVEPQHTATIELPLDGAIFYNVLLLESISTDQTRIIQRLSLGGEKAADYAKGMQMFEESAPQGLAKLAEAIEVAYRDV